MGCGCNSSNRTVRPQTSANIQNNPLVIRVPQNTPVIRTNNTAEQPRTVRAQKIERKNVDKHRSE